MGKYQKAWAKRERRLLILQLGGCCEACGTIEKLEFDCKISQGDRHHKYDTSQRMCFYRKQFKEGNLQLLCTKCNAKKGALDEDLFNRIQSDLDNNPF